MIPTLRYIDTFNTHTAHEMFNASLLVMCSLIFERVECRVSYSNYKAIQRIFGSNIPSNITYKFISVLQGISRSALIFRYLLGAINNVWQLVIAPRDRVLIYSFNNLFGLRLLNAINKLCHRQVIVFCHGEMEGLSPYVAQGGLLSRLLSKLSHNFFLNPHIKLSKGLYFSVMGSSILANLQNILPPQFIERFICIDHPYIFPKKSDKENLSNEFNFPIQMGTVGAMSQIKGLGTYLSFAGQIPAALRSKLNFSITGRLLGDLEQIRAAGIEVPDNHEYLDREHFDARIRRLDYILYFYPDTSYQITASGAIMDAIYHHKPILALKNDYFQYIFDKFGVFGFLCNSFSDMISELERLTTQKECPNFDFQQIEQKLTPQVISEQLHKELIRIGII